MLRCFFLFFLTDFFFSQALNISATSTTTATTPIDQGTENNHCNQSCHSYKIAIKTF